MLAASAGVVFVLRLRRRYCSFGVASAVSLTMLSFDVLGGGSLHSLRVALNSFKAAWPFRRDGVNKTPTTRIAVLAARLEPAVSLKVVTLMASHCMAVPDDILCPYLERTW